MQPHGTITATNVQAALEQLADQSFRSDTAPTGTVVAGVSTLSEGDTWYDTNDEQFKVYRETSNGVYEWVPIIVGEVQGFRNIRRRGLLRLHTEILNGSNNFN